jgi:type I restriction enzyme S subunit
MKKYDKYKQTKIEWLESVPSEWEIVKFKTIFDYIGRGQAPNYTEEYSTKVINQATFSKGYFNEAEIRYHSGNVGKGVVFDGDILLASTGGGVLGKVICFNNGIGYMADSHVTILRTKDRDLSKFVFNFLKINYELINGVLAEGSTNQTELQKEWLKSFQIALPPKNQLVQIINKIEFLVDITTDFIQKKEKTIELLNELHKSKINELITEGLNPSVKMKESGIDWLGEVPEHWELKRLQNIFKVKKNIAKETGYEILSITQSGIKIKDLSTNEGQLSSDYSKYQKVEKGDFAMNHMDLLTGFVDISKYDGVTSPDYRVFRLMNDTCNSRYLLYLLQMCYTRKIFYPLGRGASQLGRWRLGIEAFRTFLIPIPPRSEQDSIVEKLDYELDEINKLINKAEMQIDLIHQFRQSIIYELATGKRKP